MVQRTAIWQGEQDQQRWLSMLIDAMEEAARPDLRGKPCPPGLLASLRAQLAKPVSLGRQGASVSARDIRSGQARWPGPGTAAAKSRAIRRPA